jgi:putative ABC transport system permease protein
VLEVHAQVSRAALASDPAAAFVTSRGVRRGIERAAPGDVTVIDSLSTSLERARSDANLAKVLFVALGLPGSILAGYLAFYAGGLLAEAQRRERALLRARGFPPLALTRGLAYQSIAIGIAGAAVGIAAALGAATALFRDDFSPGDRGFVLSIALSMLVAALTAWLAVYLPGRRLLLRDLTEARRELAPAARPAWMRARLDLVLLAGAGIVVTVFVLSGGFEPNPKAQSQSVGQSFYVLLAPWCVWLGGALLTTRGFLALSRRIGSKAGTADFRRRLLSRTVVRSVARRPRAVASGILVISLAVAFGVSLAIFVATYRHEQRADARFVNGSDVRVTPSISQTLPVDFERRLHVRGVRAVSPVAQAPGAVVGTDKVLFVAVDPRTFRAVAPLNGGFFTDISPQAALNALARDRHAVLVDKETATNFNFHKGDTIKVQLPSPALGQPVIVTLRVAGTLVQFPGYPGGIDLAGNLAAYEDATGVTTPDYFLLRTDGTREANSRITTLLRSEFRSDAVVRIDTTARAANKDQTSLAGLNLTGLGRIENLYTVLIASLGIVIFVIGLLLERVPEQATIRALGLARRRLHFLVLSEAALVLVVSVIIGLLIGVPMAFLFIQILRHVFVVPPTQLSLPPSQGLFLAGLLAITLVLSAVIIGAAQRRMRVIELLRQE